jgi:amino acid transporter
MGFADLLLFVVLTTFGLPWLAKAGEVGPAGVTFWGIGGLVFYLPLALSVIVLTSRYPGEGGLYRWSQQSFGDFAGFLTGWSYWTCNLPFLASVLYFIAGSALFVGGERWQHLATDPAYFIAISLLCLAVATAVNIVGLGVGKWLHNLGAVGCWLPALGLIVLGFIAWGEHGPATSLTAARFIPEFSLKEAVVWPVLVMSLTGLEAASILGDEIQETRRRLPPALIFGAALALVTKVIATLAILAVLLSDELTGSLGFMQAFERASTRAGVGGLLPIVAIVVVVGHLGKVGAWSATNARLPFVVGVDRHLPATFARVHPRWGTPHVSLLFQAAIVAALVVVGQAGTSTKGAYEVLLSMTLIPTFIPFLFLFAAAIKLQRAEPGPGRMQSRGGRWATVPLAALGLLTTAGSMVLAVIPPSDEPDRVLYVAKVVGLAALLIGAGVVTYLAGKRRLNHAGTAADLPRV